MTTLKVRKCLFPAAGYGTRFLPVINLYIALGGAELGTFNKGKDASTCIRYYNIPLEEKRISGLLVDM